MFQLAQIWLLLESTRQGLLMMGDSAQDCCQPVFHCSMDMREETVQVLQVGAEISILT